MNLTPGTRLGPYEVIAQIGVGGMGEVYQATDTNLKRQVAIKVLPASVAGEPDRLARFQREAEVLASLNHPNIAHVHGLEKSGAIVALVMELVEGDDLSQRLTRGPIPLDEVLLIAKQIAEALEAAHEQGIVHRDLKPANIKVRADGTVKVLDFGLAKAMDTGAGGAGGAGGTGGENLTQSPTITTPAMTQMGMILGTAAYMSPEQARGKAVDRRADIWAFGVVLLEMLTGRRAFEGDDVSITLAAVLMREPDLAAVPVATPPGLRRLLARCLKKDPKARLRDIGEARIALEEVIAGATPEESSVQAPPPAPAPHKTPWLPWAAASAASVVAALAFWTPWRTAAPEADLVRLEIQAPDNTIFGAELALSPDGRHVAFTTSPSSAGGGQIWVRSLDTLKPRRLAPWSVNPGPGPFWSSDSRFIAFQQDGKLKKVDIAGGPPVTLSDAPQNFGGGAWGDGVIVIGNRAGGLLQVSSAGGVPVPLTTLDEKRQETSHAFPSFLPDGKHFVYVRRSARAEYSGTYVGLIGTAPEKQDSRQLVLTDNSAVYTPASDPRAATRGLGFLLFLRGGTLMAQPFDAAALTLKGEPVAVAEQVSNTQWGFGRFSASSNGGLAYAVGGSTRPTQMIWVDRQGKSLGSIGQPVRYASLAIAPDGSRVAVERPDGSDSDLWLIDANPGGKSDRFTSGPGLKTAPVWSPDSKELTFAAGLAGVPPNFFRKPSNLAGGEVELFASKGRKFPSDWSRDGKTLVFTSFDASPDLWTLVPGSVEKEASGSTRPKTEEFLKTAAAEEEGKLSPDGRWMAYVSNATTRREVYVRPFPRSADRTGQWMVSNGGGESPRWRRDGKELFYFRGGPAAIMAVDVDTSTVFKSEQPKELFAWPGRPAIVSLGGYAWDVTADGSRFLLNIRGGAEGEQVPITVVLNWTTGLRK